VFITTANALSQAVFLPFLHLPAHHLYSMLKYDPILPETGRRRTLDVEEQPPPHRIFFISELILEIFEWLAVDRESIEDQWGSERDVPTSARAALASLARCCKTFNWPATDILWRRLPAVGPLIKLMPSTQSQSVDQIRVSL
jgi:hypothetical protein